PEATMRPTIAEERRKGGWEAAGQDGRNRPSHPGGSEERREGGGRRARAAAGDLLGRDGGCRGRCRHGSNRGQQPHVVPRRGRGTRRLGRLPRRVGCPTFGGGRHQDGPGAHRPATPPLSGLPSRRQAEGPARGVARRAGRRQAASPKLTTADGEHEGWAGSLAALGVQPSAAGAIKMVLALTDRRLLLYRASRLGGKPKDLLAEWPVEKVDAIEPPRNNQKLTVTIDGRQLSLETPQVSKFLDRKSHV